MLLLGCVATVFVLWQPCGYGILATREAEIYGCPKSRTSVEALFLNSYALEHSFSVATLLYIIWWRCS